MIFSVKVVHRRLIEHRQSQSYKMCKFKKNLDGDFVGKNQAGSFVDYVFETRKVRKEKFFEPFRSFSLSTFQSKGYNWRLFDPRVIQKTINFNSKLDRRVQICSFRKGRIEMSKSINFNVTFATFGQLRRQIGSMGLSL